MSAEQMAEAKKSVRITIKTDEKNTDHKALAQAGTRALRTAMYLA